MSKFELMQNEEINRGEQWTCLVNYSLVYYYYNHILQPGI